MKHTLQNSFLVTVSLILAACTASSSQEPSPTSTSLPRVPASTSTSVPTIPPTPSSIISFEERLLAAIDIKYPDEIAFVQGFIWVKTDDGHVIKVDPATQTIDVSVKMELGSGSETVTVEAAGGMLALNTQDASLGNNFVTQQIVQLPMEARDVTALLTLQAGVTRDGYVAGARSDQSNITLDGVDINDAQTSSLDSTTVLRLNSEAIEEFRVTTVNPNANQGRSSAAQVNLVTKGGTNNLHGSLFEYLRDTSFTANVTATVLRMVADSNSNAAGQIGSGSDEIDTAVTTLAARDG